MFRLSRVSAHLTGGSPNDHSGWQAAARAVLTAAAAASEPSPSGNPVTARRIFSGELSASHPGLWQDFKDELNAVSFENESEASSWQTATGQHMHLLRASLSPGSAYGMHKHDDHEQFSLLVSGRLRLTVGPDADGYSETREIGPGDGWYAPAGVPHGGTPLGDEATVFIDVYSPPTESIVKLNQQMQRVTAASPALPSRLPVRSSPVADTTESVDFSRTFMTFRIDSLKKEVLTSGHSRRGDEERLFSVHTQPAGRSPHPSAAS